MMAVRGKSKLGDFGRFERFVSPEPNSGCWLWTGTGGHLGYGLFKIDGRDVCAHRQSYEFHKGKIPDGLVIDHLCRVPSCVNPDHLEAVTYRENARRGISHLANKAKQTHCIRGHEFNLENTIIRPNGTRKCRACAHLYKRGLA